MNVLNYFFYWGTDGNDPSHSEDSHSPEQPWLQGYIQLDDLPSVRFSVSANAQISDLNVDHIYSKLEDLPTFVHGRKIV